ncbi:hypothetical protein TNCT_408741 [Trichonephila clavata]|uniref:Uncharacterized protein n=1 Tax=Trichonephila clavata TaxID=2740835 RepID=A0A8X6HR83_TRICU|nr:hypothetical protein TNCT_408741 [Trichonephila clavata]
MHSLKKIFSTYPCYKRGSMFQCPWKFDKQRRPELAVNIKMYPKEPSLEISSSIFVSFYLLSQPISHLLLLDGANFLRLDGKGKFSLIFRFGFDETSSQRKSGSVQ